jgi:hypothetical protein
MPFISDFSTNVKRFAEKLASLKGASKWRAVLFEGQSHG